jgi:Protein of unknown function (DUF1153)
VTLIFHPLAEREFIAAARFYEARAPGLGADFIRQVERILSEIVVHPNSGSLYLAPLGNRATNSTRSKRPSRWTMAEEQRPEEVQRWTAKRRAALVISLLKGETTAAEAARRHGLKLAEVEDWRERFLLGAENALRARPKEDEALREAELNRFKRKVGELTIDLEILQRRPGCALRRRGRRTSDGDVARRIDAQSV